MLCTLRAGKTGAACISYLKENRVAELTFLPLDQLKVGGCLCGHMLGVQRVPG